tara:strand:+ start:474 stop:902 length:429 start_codon:yes stop_codon:yes gene_type:complete
MMDLTKIDETNELMIRLIKVFDIGLLGIYYLFGALLFISFFNGFFKFIYKKKEEDLKKIPTWKLVSQVSIQAACICILGYVLRKIIKSIPFPLEGLYGYEHLRTKEVNGGVVIAFGMLTAFSDFKDRVSEITKRLEIYKITK